MLEVFFLHSDTDFYNSSGEPILPSTADAAATKGLHRYTSLFGWPMRPTKLRFVVASARSPEARIPMCPPRQGPQQGGPMTAPASRKVSMIPSLLACFKMVGDAGMTIRRRPFA